ncbi:MAG: diaminopimelate decarboxylase, partial [Saprospiraceae bacterium]
MKPSIDPKIFVSVAGKFGLPLFVYDASIINQQIQNLRNAFDVAQLEIRYASKAQSTIAILQHIYQHGCGIDTVSPGEIIMALKA